MKILVLGGTLFLGRAVVESALERGHQVTLFHRGQTHPGLFPEAEKIHGDRARDLSALAGRRFDAVVDTCGFSSAVVGASARRLADSVSHYTFVSSMSVYPDEKTPNQDESSPVAEHPPGEEDEDDISTYGARKALCERAAEEAMPGRVLHVRAGMIVGPHDYVDRFAYWVGRVARGGEVLAPGRPERRVELVDARDLGDWMVRMAEGRGTGVYNASGPDRVLTWGEVLDTCNEAGGAGARFTWVDDDFLVAHAVGAFGELPFWLPEREYPGFFHMNCSKAQRDGLRFRPLLDTVRDTLTWMRARDKGSEPEPQRRLKFLGQVGMEPDRERALLRDWKLARAHT